jgi:uncharacterized small protein (DUF1192 family)
VSILPSAVLTTAQIVGNLIASAKNARDLAKASSDHELKASISELYDSLIDVKARVSELDEENRRLTAELARKGQIVGPNGKHGYFFHKDNLEQPLCPKCFQSQPSNAVFLGPLHQHNYGLLRKCPVCDYGKYEEPPRSRSVISMQRG